MIIRCHFPADGRMESSWERVEESMVFEVAKCRFAERGMVSFCPTLIRSGLLILLIIARSPEGDSKSFCDKSKGFPF